MNDPQSLAIEINSLRKRYFNSKKELKNLLFSKIENEGFLALNGISLKIPKGECFGLIGKNGSGKSTLLQILSGILKPSSGNFIVKGKIASILELGSGFNPEFSGKENIYLNSLLYGLSRKEILEKYDDILNFAEIGDFIDRPVKEYSSGMLMRLAFAVIVNIDADILLVDEALSVGDIYFNQKCIRFFNDYKKRGTLLIVSHDLQILSSICDRVALIDKGEIIEIGEVKNVLNCYLNEFRQNYSAKNNRDGKNNLSVIKNNIKTPPIIERNLSRSVKIYIGHKKVESFGNNNQEIIRIDNDCKESKTGKFLIYKVQLNDMINECDNIIGLNVRNSKGMLILSEIFEINVRMKNFQLKLKIPYLVGGEFSLEIGLASGTLDDHQFNQMIFDFERWHVSHEEGDFGIIHTECELFES